jgi:hypothetical protein
MMASRSPAFTDFTSTILLRAMRRFRSTLRFSAAVVPAT